MVRRACVAAVLAVFGGGCLVPVLEGPPPAAASAGPACSHATCSGCCVEGVCASGYDDEACGLLGRVCEACSVLERCSPTRRCAVPPDAGRDDWVPLNVPDLPPDPNAPPGNSGPPDCQQEAIGC